MKPFLAALSLASLLAVAPSRSLAQTAPTPAASATTQPEVGSGAVPPPPPDPQFAQSDRVTLATPAQSRQRKVVRDVVYAGAFTAALGVAVIAVDGIVAVGWMAACIEGCASWWYTDFPRGLWTVFDVGAGIAAVGAGVALSGVITRVFLGREWRTATETTAAVLPWVDGHSAGLSFGVRF